MGLQRMRLFRGTAGAEVLTGAGAGGLVFDGKPYRWALCEQRKTDKQNGYGALKTWWLCHFGK